MKKISVFILSIVTGICTAQNLITNGSFENHTDTCPTGSPNGAVITQMLNWRPGNYIPAHGQYPSVDLYCGGPNYGNCLPGPPSQLASDGVAYIGFHTRILTPAYNESVYQVLATPLTAGNAYTISFDAVTCQSGLFINGPSDLCVYTNIDTIVPACPYNNPGVVNVGCVPYNSLSKTAWNHHNFQFTAPSNSNVIIFSGGTCNTSEVYYYLDNVVLTPDTQLCNLSPANITADQTIFCSGDSAQVCAPSGYASYLWNTGETTACIKAKLAGNYYVTVTDHSGCTAESNHLSITVLPLPPVAISINGDTLSVYGAITQQWYLNGSAINNATSNIYIATQGGSYTVVVTDSNGCLATSSAVIVSGIDNVTEEDVVSVYPNPLTDGGWQLTVGNNFIGSEVEVFDADGRVVFKSAIRNPQFEIATMVAKGVYLLRISSAKSSVVRKLIRL